MTGRRQQRKRARINHLFSKCVVTWCIFWGTVFVFRVLEVAESGMVSAADLVAILIAGLGFFGGELVLLFGNSAIGKSQKRKKIDIETEEMT